MQDREPVLHPTPIADLRPTQMTVGLREVARKEAQWRERAAKHGDDFLGRHLIPAVLGRKRQPWIIDNHHLVLALHRAGQSHVLVRVVADLAHLPRRLFLTVMDNRSWLHPFDARGRRRDPDDLPRQVAGLVDDPYRSLAGEVRRAGGYAKDATPFSEFLWADYLRRQLKSQLVADHFDEAVQRALEIAKHPTASYLPGWAGLSE